MYCFEFDFSVSRLILLTWLHVKERNFLRIAVDFKKINTQEKNDLKLIHKH